MSLMSWWKHPCRFGHKWFYVRGVWCPFPALVGENLWRGCTVCHKDQVSGHDSAAGSILEWHWVEAPHLRVYEEWRSLCHPSGWTRKWYDPPEISTWEWLERGGYAEIFHRAATLG